MMKKYLKHFKVQKKSFKMNIMKKNNRKGNMVKVVIM